MKPFIKASGLGLVILTTSLFATATEAAQKIGFVATGTVLSQMAKKNNVTEKLRNEFKDRIAALQAVEEKMKKALEKLKRDGEMMSDTDRTKLQRDLKAWDSDLKLKVTNLKEDERKRSTEEQQKLVKSLQDAVNQVAKKDGYDVILDKQAVLFSNPADDLSDKVLKAVK